MAFSALLKSHWQEVRKARLSQDAITVDGRSLTLGAVVAVARSDLSHHHFVPSSFPPC